MPVGDLGGKKKIKGKWGGCSYPDDDARIVTLKVWAGVNWPGGEARKGVGAGGSLSATGAHVDEIPGQVPPRALTRSSWSKKKN